MEGFLSCDLSLKKCLAPRLVGAYNVSEMSRGISVLDFFLIRKLKPMFMFELIDSSLIISILSAWNCTWPRLSSIYIFIR